MEHYYDRCDGGICLKCDQCLHKTCCPQTEECTGKNWEFLDRLHEYAKKIKEERKL